MTKKRIVIIILSVVLVGTIGYGITQGKGSKKLHAEITKIEAPEQTESEENPAFIKEEYASVLPEGTNIAPEGKVDANGFNQTFTPRKAVDGMTDGASYWEGSADSYPNELLVKFKEERNIHAIRVALNPASVWGKRTQSFYVTVSYDGESYETLVEEKAYDFDPDRGNEVIIEFDDIDVRAVALNFTANTGATGGQVAEFEIYSR
ncbi:discoidin domain-containing protein [Anaerosporobacter sp.]|uniref:discoidin domain-containing protein n=1 Tax=Anaerosporobacter sp. TaxID=1872529 RepID=UPI00286FAC36|nr:discoidin domain-containing protein [Anaerosporobacter sp.]